jgi:galactokinase
MREIAVRAPGRVNLIGDHTDYNDGFVLPLAIDRDCRIVGTTTAGVLEVRWAQGGDENSLRIANAVREELGASEGLDVEVSSTVPVGAGLSSSAALAVAFAVAFREAAGLALDARQLAQACRRAETAATGVPVGIMDQLASATGLRGHALLIDCRSLEITPVPIPDELAVLVCDSGTPRHLAGSAYAERRSACEAAAARIGVPALRDATAEQVADDPRARHVVSENARVLAAADALARGSLAELGRLMLESHASLRDDYEVSTPELDALVDLFVASGAAGARLTGAGFGGCVVAVAERDRVADLLARMRRTPAPFLVHAVDGAGRIE